MRRRYGGRDLELTLRMSVVLALLVSVHAAAVAGLVLLLRLAGGVWLVWLGVAVVALWWAIVARYRRAEGAFLDTVGARVVDEEEEPELHRIVVRLAAMLDVTPPRVAVTRSGWRPRSRRGRPEDLEEVPNAFVVGFAPQRAVIVFTRRLLELLDPEELEAVVAHELTHVASRDAFVMTIAGTAKAAGAETFGREGNDWTLGLWFFLWPVGALLWALGSLLTLALSRHRELVADRGSAMLTGAPEQLMSALQKLSRDVAGIPRADLRAYGGLNAFFIVPVWPHPRFTLLMDHPPLEKRLDCLAQIARELGKPAR